MSLSDPPSAPIKAIRLSPSTYLHPPPTSAAPPPDHPATIILLGWMNGSTHHLRTYIRNYRLLYPHTPILTITSSALDFYFPSRTTPSLTPGLTYLRTTPGPILVHAFSNGGLHTGFRLFNLAQSTGAPIALRAVIIDSAPGVGTLAAVIRAMTADIKNVFVKWALKLLMATTWGLYLVVYMRLMRRKDLLTVVREAWNDGVFCPREVRRCYIYSQGDRMITAPEVVSHADEAEEKGYVVRREDFGGSGHVLHARESPERYWKVVQEVWEGAA